MNLGHFRTKLNSKREKLEEEIKYYRKEDPYSDKTRARGILEDDITEIEEHDRLSATKAELEKTLKEVDVALQRIDQGKFGNCTNCGGQISQERLEIMPTVSLCLTCKQKKIRA